MIGDYQKRVVIVGAGFGGLRAARELAGHGLDVWLLDRQNYHLCQPLLYQVATASVEQESIAHPVRRSVRHWEGVHFRLTEVEDVDLDARQVITTAGPLDYDILVMAAGALAEPINRVLAKGYPPELIEEARIILVEMMDAVLRPYSEKLRAYAAGDGG